MTRTRQHMRERSPVWVQRATGILDRRVFVSTGILDLPGIETHPRNHRQETLRLGDGVGSQRASSNPDLGPVSVPPWLRDTASSPLLMPACGARSPAALREHGRRCLCCSWIFQIQITALPSGYGLPWSDFPVWLSSWSVRCDWPGFSANAFFPADRDWARPCALVLLCAIVPSPSMLGWVLITTSHSSKVRFKCPEKGFVREGEDYAFIIIFFFNF